MVRILSLLEVTSPEEKKYFKIRVHQEKEWVLEDRADKPTRRDRTNWHVCEPVWRIFNEFKCLFSFEGYMHSGCFWNWNLFCSHQHFQSFKLEVRLSHQNFPPSVVGRQSIEQIQSFSLKVLDKVWCHGQVLLENPFPELSQSAVGQTPVGSAICSVKTGGLPGKTLTAPKLLNSQGLKLMDMGVELKVPQHATASTIRADAFLLFPLLPTVTCAGTAWSLPSAWNSPPHLCLHFSIGGAFPSTTLTAQHSVHL